LKPYNFCRKHLFRKCLVFKIFYRSGTFYSPYIITLYIGNINQYKGNNCTKKICIWLYMSNCIFIFICIYIFIIYLFVYIIFIFIFSKFTFYKRIMLNLFFIYIFFYHACLENALCCIRFCVRKMADYSFRGIIL